MNVRMFIVEVKKRKVLWDHSNRQHHKNEINDGWQHIARMFNIEVNTAKQKWKNLRDTFRVELKKTKRYAGSENSAKNTWAYYGDMYFLKDILKTRKQTDFGEGTSAEISTDNIKIENEMTFSPSRLTDDNDNDNCANFCIENISSLRNDENYNADTTNESTNVKMKRKRISEDDDNDDQDDDLLFFRSLLPFVKRLDQDKKLLFRMNVQQMLYNQLYD